MLVSSKQCEIRRTSDRLEIISILQEIPSVTQSSDAILIGSRAGLHYFPNFRDLNASDIDWDIISSSTFLLQWLDEADKAIDTIEMIIPTSNEDQLDLYITYTLNNKSKYDFAIPRSSTSYTAYLLNNFKYWTRANVWWHKKGAHLVYGSSKLLLLLKKHMLYYSHQWEKTAKDYRQLLTINNSFTDEDNVLCDLLIRYNEKLHGKRSLDTTEFVITSYDNKQDIIISREKFFQYKMDEQILCVYQAARQMSIDDNILIGLEYICTKSPPWLADFVINNWIDIQNEKFKQNFQLSRPCIQFDINNYRLFQQLPELIIQKILLNITDPLDFYSMKFVCKSWYIILTQHSFWRDLYLSHYGQFYGDINKVTSWKLLYLMKLENEIKDDSINLEQLVDATIHLRQITANDVLRLLEDFTHQNQSVNSNFLSQIDYILSHSYYYHRNESSNNYSVKLILIGLDHPRSRSKVNIDVYVGEYGSSYFTDHMEQLSIECDKNSDNYRSFSFMGPHLFGIEMGERSYYYDGTTLLTESPSKICPALPSSIAICLFIMMVHPAHRPQFISYLKNMKARCRAIPFC